jgi:heme oxygenase
MAKADRCSRWKFRWFPDESKLGKADKLHVQLKQATHELHVLLNRHFLLSGLTQPAYPLENYRRVLIAYFYLYQGLELRINAFLDKRAGEFDYTARVKLPWLVSDLNYLDIAVPPPELPLLASLNFPEISNVDQLLGVLYTIEGSTLGGQVIARSLSKNFGLSAGQGASFFNGYGEQTSSMWQAFLGYVSAASEQKAQYAEVEQAAVQTFRLFKQVLDNMLKIRRRCASNDDMLYRKQS